MPDPLGQRVVVIPLATRLTPTLRVAEVCLVGLTGSPESEAPNGITPPLSWPLGPVPLPGEPACKPSHCFITCACAQLVKLVVSANCGTWLNSGSAVELFPPAPFQATGIRL